MTSHPIQLVRARAPAPTLPAAPALLAMVLLAMVLLAVALVGAGCSESGGAAEAGAGPGQVTTTPPPPVVVPVDHTPPAPRPTGPVETGKACVSSGCHGNFTTARFVHGVVRGPDQCSVCHEADQGGHVYPLRRSGNATCTFCHEDVFGHREHQHGAAAVTCLVCHDPHVADRGALLRAPVADLCGVCHPPETHAVPHGPFATGSCVACHEPHESDHPKLLRAVGAEHCFRCHRETEIAMREAPRVHAPAGQSCLICHAAHGSEHQHVLKRAVDATCFSCHADLEQTIAGVGVPHGALVLRDQCANCHDAHASSRPSLLKDRQDVLCLQCHDETIKANDGRTIPAMTASIHDRAFLHGPVQSANCTACHNVHGSSQSRLLRQKFTEAFYASFDLEDYALCFECHEQEVVTAERTTSLTDFRDGDLNLHYVHVHRDKKGRTCRACHEIHGSDLPSHVAETVPFAGSSWPLPIAFEPTATGGSCAPGCHKPMSYSREPNPPPSGDE